MKIKKLDLKYNDDLGFKRDKMSNGFCKKICVINPNQASSDVYGGQSTTMTISQILWGCRAFAIARHDLAARTLWVRLWTTTGDGGYCSTKRLDG